MQFQASREAELVKGRRASSRICSTLEKGVQFYSTVIGRKLVERVLVPRVVALTALSISTIPEPVLQAGLKAFPSIISIMHPTLGRYTGRDLSLFVKPMCHSYSESA